MLRVNRSAIEAPALPSKCDVREITPHIHLPAGDIALVLEDGAKSWLIWFTRKPDGTLEWASEHFQAHGPDAFKVADGTIPTTVEVKLRGPLGADGTPTVTQSYSKGVFLHGEIADMLEPARQRPPAQIAEILAAWDAKRAGSPVSNPP
jgi:hypothetical protein